ncbi:hypothetical protein M0R45_023831 [Rubus argutus]|uniref:Uncharacterized protein n=1 Tax=Rubus argutus TaxID=59490 RepID=A0AAW1WRD4_RUBAR
MPMNPDPCEAVDEVFNEVFSQPIRPDFAIVYIGMEFSLTRASLFVFKKLHRGVSNYYQSSCWANRRRYWS